MITTITLNASIDKAYYMDRAIENGTVMRVASTRNSAGGKGLNVARVIKLCGEEVKATGLAGGFNGQYLEYLLQQDGIANDFEHVSGETRSCINILDPEYGSTEYLESGCEVSQEEIDAFLARIPEIVKNSEVVTISGSAPKGVSKDIYAKLVALLKKLGKLVILDTSGELLEKGLKACPAMVKPNKEEMEMLLGIEIHSMKEVLSSAKRIYTMGIPYVVISLGGDGAMMVCEEGVYRAAAPQIKVVNTVGCGDSMVGAFAVAISRKYKPEEALKYAVAVASANAMSPNTGDFDPKVMEVLLEKTEICRIE